MRGEDRVVRAGELDQQVRDGLGEAVGEGGRVGEQHPGHPLDRRRRFRRAPAAFPAHEQVNVGVELPRRRDCAEGRVEDGRAVVLGIDENAHQITLASFWSLLTRPATSSTMTPAWRCGGSLTETTVRRGSGDTPSSSGLTASIGFFFAFMMLGREA